MEDLKKIHIIYTNAGAGHRRAAEALYRVVGEYFPKSEIRLYDVLDYATSAYRKVYPQSYLFMVNYCPWLWGFFFYLVDCRLIYPLVRLFRRTTNSIHCRGFERYILKEQPDLVITTHFLPNEIITHLKQAKGFKTRLVSCITDYYPHLFWRDSGVDYYFTSNDDLAERLVRWGVNPDRIHDFGIPIMPEFSESANQSDMRRKLNLHEEFTVLITSGGYGVGPVEELVKQINQIQTPLQVLVICGNNPKLQEDINELVIGSRHHYQIYGFVNNMYELMMASDVMISKAGGLTTTEAMAKQLPLIILYPIPGQESSNCEFLLQHQASLRAKNPCHARKWIVELLAKPERLHQLKENIGRLSRPQAANKICAFLRQLVEKEDQ